MVAPATVDAVSLACIRGQRLLFRDLSFRVGAGEVLSLEGRNGAGKTSLLRLIAGFIAPAAGTVAIGEATDPEARARRIGWLGHHDAAKPQLSPREVLSFYASLYGIDADRDAALADVGLRGVASLPCQYLSAGQKKRLALARLVLTRRPVWLIDEPLAALDGEGKALVARLLEAHARAGGIAIAATHEPLGTDCTALRLGAGDRDTR